MKILVTICYTVMNEERNWSTIKPTSHSTDKSLNPYGLGLGLGFGLQVFLYVRVVNMFHLWHTPFWLLTHINKTKLLKW